MTDPVSDFLIRIQNAYSSQREKLEVPKSSQKVALAEILKRNKKIAGYNQDKEKKILEIKLKYSEEKPAISHIKIYSLPGRRIYLKSKDLRKFGRSGGMIVISTSAGLKTAQEAILEKQGGELICQIY
jgi:small subunit ribosomal protein S8